MRFGKKIRFLIVVIITFILPLFCPALHAATIFDDYVQAFKNFNKDKMQSIVKLNKDDFAQIFYAIIHEVCTIVGNSYNNENLQRAGIILLLLSNIAKDYSEVFPHEDFLYSFIKDSIFDLPPNFRINVYSDLSFSDYLLKAIPRVQNTRTLTALKSELTAIIVVVESPEKQYLCALKKIQEQIAKEKEEKERAEAAERERIAKEIRERERKAAYQKAVENIALLKTNRDIDGLVRIIETSTESDIQNKAIGAIGEIDDPGNAVKILKYLYNNALQDSTIAALVNIANENAVLGLIKYAGDSGNDEKICKALQCLGELPFSILANKINNPEDMTDLKKNVRIFKKIGGEPGAVSLLAVFHTFLAQPSFSGFLRLSFDDWLREIRQAKTGSLKDTAVKFFVIFRILLPAVLLLLIIITAFLIADRNWIWPKLKLTISQGGQQEIALDAFAKGKKHVDKLSKKIDKLKSLDKIFELFQPIFSDIKFKKLIEFECEKGPDWQRVVWEWGKQAPSILKRDIYNYDGKVNMEIKKDACKIEINAKMTSKPPAWSPYLFQYQPIPLVVKTGKIIIWGDESLIERNPDTANIGQFYFKKKGFRVHLLKYDYRLEPNKNDDSPFVSWAKNRISKFARIRLFSFSSGNFFKNGIIDVAKSTKKGKYILEGPDGGFIKVKVI